jgi:hypothetical protein
MTMKRDRGGKRNWDNHNNEYDTEIHSLKSEREKKK